MRETAHKIATAEGKLSGGVPVRQCVGCRGRMEKRRLLRFVPTAQGGWMADSAARLPGRGAYLCSPQCIERLRKNKRYKTLSEALVATGAWPRRDD
ncbi:MAG: YlxR family protein [Candidatus Eremiobacteraeota bacterium]|nr:YlxR family protein [Candidatus Eremiobacteraeota bacterium]MBC5826224.1 YlxR family protein [Candidatus Eremiobacteraeota bacterium]